MLSILGGDAALLAKLQQSGWMFLQLFAELTGLFLVISYGVALVNQRLPEERVRALLGARRGSGYLMAAGLGALTPFCTCSTIPMLIGLLKARAGFGPTLTFLFISPLLNPIVIALFIPVLGWEATLLYAGLAFGASMGAGFALNRLGFERFVRGEFIDSPASSRGGSCSETELGLGAESGGVQVPGRWQEAWRETRELFGSMFPFMLIAIVMGALVHGFVPADFFAEVAGAGNPLAVPIAALIGIPLYVPVSALLPLAGSFVAKGVSLGAVIALVIGGGGASLPEVIMLKRLFHWPLLAAFLLVVFCMAVAGGVAFDWILS